MADNTQVNTGTGDTIRSKDRSGVKTEIVALDLNPAGTESIMAGWMPVASRALTQTSGTVTTSTSTVTATTDVSNAASATVWTSGTHVGVNLTLEASPDGTNWWTVWAQNTSSFVQTVVGATGVLVSNASTAFNVSLPPGTTQFRARATAYTSGTLNVVISPSVAPVSPLAPALNALGDGMANPTLAPGGFMEVFNNSTWDRLRCNFAMTVTASTTNTTVGATNSTDVTNYNARGGVLFFAVSAISGTSAAITYKVQIKDSVSSTYVDVPGAVTASITAVTSPTVALWIYPGVTVVANQSVSYPLNRTFRVVSTLSGTTPSVTNSISYNPNMT